MAIGIGIVIGVVGNNMYKSYQAKKAINKAAKTQASAKPEETPAV